MYGVFVDDKRPQSKKQVKEAVQDNPDRVHLQATSMFGDEYSGPLSVAPAGTYTFVGPDPYTNRRFYGNIIVSEMGIRVS